MKHSIGFLSLRETINNKFTVSLLHCSCYTKYKMCILFTKSLLLFFSNAIGFYDRKCKVSPFHIKFGFQKFRHALKQHRCTCHTALSTINHNFCSEYSDLDPSSFGHVIVLIFIYIYINSITRFSGNYHC